MIFKEYDYDKPYNIFIIDKNIFGYKKDLDVNKHPLIYKDDLIGSIKSIRKEDRLIIIDYDPYSDNDKDIIFNKIKYNNKINISYPFIVYDKESNKEKVMSIDEWNYLDGFLEHLNNGEIYFRNITKRFLNSGIDLNDKRIYDPACSTGLYIYSIKEMYSNCYTIGHDINEQMAKYSSKYVDESGVYNAIQSPIKDKSIDLLILRFLNSEVVFSKDAYLMFDILINKVINNGYIFLFGYTPVLIDYEYILKKNLKIVSCNSYIKEEDAICQFYILQK